VSLGAGPGAEKARLRAAVQAWRRALTPEQVARWSEEIAGHALAWEPLARARVVLAYAALAREPQTAGLIRALADRGALVALPRVVGPALEAWPLGGSAEPLPAAALDAVLVPGLAFDAAGRRLGRGGGHYDRLLPRLRPDCLRVGLSFEGQLLAGVPVEIHDQAVGAVVTEAGVREVGRHGGGG
jgi:5-formyltetrahydrofolate cyclo-ligase